MSQPEPDPTVDVDMLIRRPAVTVYEAFADPQQITRFWLAESTGRLERGAHVAWAFKVAGARTEVDVLDAIPGELLDLAWDEGQPLRISFEDRGDSTIVSILSPTSRVTLLPLTRSSRCPGSRWCSPRSSCGSSTASRGT